MNEDTLRALAEDVIKHITFAPMQDVYGKPYVEISLQVGSRTIITRQVLGRESERDTLPVALAALADYLRKTKPIVKVRNAGVKVGER